MCRPGLGGRVRELVARRRDDARDGRLVVGHGAVRLEEHQQHVVAFEPGRDRTSAEAAPASRGSGRPSRPRARTALAAGTSPRRATSTCCARASRASGRARRPRRARLRARRARGGRAGTRSARATAPTHHASAATNAASSAVARDDEQADEPPRPDLGQHRRHLRQVLRVPVEIHGPAVESRRRDLGVAAEHEREHEQRQRRRAPSCRAAARTTSMRRARATARRARARARRAAAIQSVGQTLLNVSAAFKTSSATASAAHCRADSGAALRHRRLTTARAARANERRRRTTRRAPRAPRAPARRSTAARRRARARRAATRSARRRRLGGAGSAGSAAPSQRQGPARRDEQIAQQPRGEDPRAGFAVLPDERREHEDQQRIGLHVEPRAEGARLVAAARERAVDAVEGDGGRAEADERPAERRRRRGAEQRGEQHGQRGPHERHRVGGAERLGVELPSGEPEQERRRRPRRARPRASTSAPSPSQRASSAAAPTVASTASATAAAAPRGQRRAGERGRRSTSTTGGIGIRA